MITHADRRQATGNPLMAGTHFGTKPTSQPSFRFVNNRAEGTVQRVLQEDANRRMLQLHSPFKLRAGVSTGDVVQGNFYIRDANGLSAVQPGNPGPNMRPFIGPSGQQETQLAGGVPVPVVFEFNKTGLARQRQKGTRGAGGNTTGLTLGDKAEFDAAGGPGAGGAQWPGSRQWPTEMKGGYRKSYWWWGSHQGSATNQRGAVTGVPHGQSSWGHQVAKQWGGPATLDNSVSATNDDTAGSYAQEEYQTIAEDAVNYVVAHNGGIQLSDFRLKHTVYKYSGTNVAKYVRFKIYHRNPANGAWVLVVDQVTPDFAQYLAGGRAQAGTGRRAFQMQLENQLAGVVAVHPQKHGTDAGVVRSWAATPTPARPAQGGGFISGLLGGWFG